MTNSQLLVAEKFTDSMAQRWPTTRQTGSRELFSTISPLPPNVLLYEINSTPNATLRESDLFIQHEFRTITEITDKVNE